MFRMDLTHILDHRFYSTRDGAIWTESLYEHSYWRRYLQVFDRVRIVSRVRDAGEKGASWKRVDGNGIEVAGIPDYLGPLEYLTRRRLIMDAVKDALRLPTSVILRFPSQLSTCAASVLRRFNRPFGVEVVGDPLGSFASGAVKHPLRFVSRSWYVHNQRVQCRRAIAAAYVSDGLRSNYPPATEVFSMVCSDAQLDRHWFYAKPRPTAPLSAPL